MTQTSGPVVSKFKYRSKVSKTFWLTIATIAAVVVIAAVISAVIINHIDAKDTCNSNANNYLLKQASQEFKDTNISQLSDTASTIKMLPNYQKDPSCMYIETVYYAKIFNVNQAQNSINIFNKDYNGKNVSPLLLKYASVSALRQLVLSTKQQLQQVQLNAQKLSPQPATEKTNK